MENGEILVIDLFAGPGGLGEGISATTDKKGNKPFDICISVEKEPSAHKTLTTRAFFRKIKSLNGGLDYYNKYLQGEISRDELFAKFPEQSVLAFKETLEGPKALGNDNELIHNRIRELIKGHNGPKLVIGGPPCQAYSLAGRSRNAGIENYKAEKDHRNFLYLEYLKVLSIAQPDIFVMENVKGILSAKINDKLMFPHILKDLRKPGRVTKIKGVSGYKIYSLVTPAENPKNPQYKISSDFLIKAENYGIPQARHRVILLGVREDLDCIPKTIDEVKHRVTVEEALSDLPPLRSGFSKQTDNQVDWEEQIAENAKVLTELLKEKFSEEEISNLSLSPIRGLSRSCSNRTSVKPKMPNKIREWYLSDSPTIVLNHESKKHMNADLLRYGFSAAFTKLNNGISPKSRDFPLELAPKHKNWESGDHADRFRTQAANKPSNTVTSHMSKDGHSFIHYDPQQCRSLTVREAARLQTFPDNYFFEGTKTDQYVQVGNAVPPYLAKKIGEIVLDLLI
ncbi:DNA cytosine methyltransferase [Pseudoalteromonas sp. Hal040]|uniref:DNA cytosine methyltransferase n=1 Tax=unclassified Pseudoalteromonas TaxID=194690 RepID=UPI00301BA011